MERLAAIGGELLGQTLARLDDLTPQAQDDAAATFAPILKKEDGLIDWSQSAYVVARRVRGLQPWPNAHTSFRSKGLIIWEAEPLPAVAADVVHGEVIVARGDELFVKCGEQTALRLFAVQPEARKRIPVRDFINGMHLKVGERFG
jgi:methionyl-tRNA formyltransferase